MVGINELRETSLRAKILMQQRRIATLEQAASNLLEHLTPEGGLEILASKRLAEVLKPEATNA